MDKEIRALAVAVRESIEPHWSPELLYEKYTTNPGSPLSSGYCGPSSVFLWQELTDKFPEQSFSIAVGRVYKGSQEWIKGKHVWVVWHHGLKSATIVDITADQSSKLDDKIIFDNIDELAKRGISYVSYNLAESLEEVDESPKRRAELLRAKLAA